MNFLGNLLDEKLVHDFVGYLRYVPNVVTVKSLKSNITGAKEGYDISLGRLLNRP